MEERRNSGLKVFLKHFAIGGSANFAARTVFAPLERIKLILQVKDFIPAGDSYSGVFNYLTQAPRREGIKSFWKGNMANLPKLFSSSVFRFALHYRIEYYLQSDSQKSKLELFVRNLAISSLSGSVALIAAFPFDQVRFRQAVDTRTERIFHGTIDCVNKITKAQGLKGLYQGLGISLLGVVPYQALAFTIHDALKEPVIESQDLNTFLRFFGIGSISALISSTVFYPIDTIRRRRMIDIGLEVPIKYNGLIDCISRTISQQGVFSLFRGCGVNIIKTVPAVGLQFAIYDWLCESFNINLEIE